MWFQIGRRYEYLPGREGEVQERGLQGAKGWIRYLLTSGLRPRPSIPPSRSFSIRTSASFLIPHPRARKRDPLNETDWLYRPDKRDVESHREIPSGAFFLPARAENSAREREGGERLRATDMWEGFAEWLAKGSTRRGLKRSTRLRCTLHNDEGFCLPRI